MEDIELHQDNMIAMLLEINGKELITNFTNHIQVQYFFIKYRIENRNLSL